MTRRHCHGLTIATWIPSNDKARPGPCKVFQPGRSWHPHAKLPARTPAFGLELVLSVLGLYIAWTVGQKTGLGQTWRSHKGAQRTVGCGPCCICSVVLGWEEIAFSRSLCTQGAECRICSRALEAASFPSREIVARLPYRNPVSMCH